MKKIVLATMIAAVVTACNNGSENKQQPTPADSSQVLSDSASVMYFGEKITEEGAITMNELGTQMGDKKEMELKVTGEVEKVCQKKGCWMNIKNENGEAMRVTFKDYGFFMPKDCSGKTAIMQGVARVEETSVDMLKEYARDAKKTKEEVDAIKEPKRELVFEASGVILK